ncbi:MAG: ribonuclease III [Candidatus Nealsonbacteria bacterium RIFCSPLOWO2_12_FULL_39_31]|uniref:Ribonuclease 3 n=3 Tax=Candidatus Nealsoniibacteriota TaxID=1817911 RepID=A0A1G2EFX5_9BACT|nr:MAG: ribonuclease III [Candidatus Nealsonbacteria bacterium RIFCSPHIGHO2_01_FULL_38_55]OGZ20946.1 MAG: ribonuclease III [Candidatus Nealsonbacteria bacterium RIFCSPHIGHO2_02_FULL_38_75]OGZ21022.1 MAG: ribonuclease III [Candidatus Nealsonbacteria bacterium RIFCSPHIGHO2_02_38_10]OGZ22857.1 MAG: ribonuclease III [Candidatus Nealsonbacteria bacterium RIFCSPHIGHO2_12_FULL_38_18]OGZ23797.1 MAG: ribonuclease III [Candidatus Nealsonbacteria bacterium RIFCSPLOWO2_01_FULL_38_120]OGZ24695.1 MAG: ribon
MKEDLESLRSTAGRKFSELEEKFNILFKDKALLVQAFVHRSFLNENPKFWIFHNERLEFLGDAILEQVVTEYLYKHYPEKAEGELTSWRAALVNAKILSEKASELGLSDFLLLSQGELKEGGKARQYILANTFESFIGALYLDQGINSCNNFITTHLIKELDRIVAQGLYKDSKSRFQEEAQERVSVTPAYSVLEECGPDHEKKFVIGVFLGKDLIAKGAGLSKQEAEEDAAKNALIIKEW